MDKKLVLLSLLIAFPVRAQLVSVATSKVAAAGPGVPTLVQGPFSAPNDVTNLESLATVNTTAAYEQTCFARTTQTGNTIIAEYIGTSAVANMAVTDDGSSSNTYAIPSGASEVAGGQTIAYYTASVTHASTCVRVTFTSTTTVSANQLKIWEYQNLGTVDQTCAATRTSGTAPACSAMTTTANGDFIIAGVSVVSFGAKPTGSMHFTAQASWALSTNDGTDWSADQTITQSTLGAITPAITTSTAVTRANVVGVAFKAATTGSGRPSSGPYLVSFQRQDDWGFSTAGTSTSQTFYFPCTAGLSGASLWLLVGNIDTTTVSAVSDNINGSWTGLTRVDSIGDGFSIQWYHVDSATCSSTLAVTLTYGANPSALVPLWDFFVVAKTASGYDSGATCGSGSTPCAINTSCASTTTVGGATITPSGYPALILSYTNQDFNTISAVNVGKFLTAVEVCPNLANGCTSAGAGTNYMYVGNGLDQDAGVTVDSLASSSAAISWTVQNTQNQNVGPCFSSTVSIK